jgi:hypothetical protein
VNDEIEMDAEFVGRSPYDVAAKKDAALKAMDQLI